MVTAVRVQVTQQDIAEGIPASLQYCPCALATKRVIPGTQPYFTTWCWTPDDLRTFDLPVNVSDWIIAFDAAEKVYPFEFDLDVPDDLLAGAS